MRFIGQIFEPKEANFKGELHSNACEKSRWKQFYGISDLIKNSSNKHVVYDNLHLEGNVPHFIHAIGTRISVRGHGGSQRP